MHRNLNKKGQAAPSSPAPSPQSGSAPSPSPSPSPKSRKKVKSLASKFKRTYSCELCGAKFPSKTALYAHLQSVHGYSPELIKMEEDSKKSRRLIQNPGATVRSAKKYTSYIIIFLIVIVLPLSYYFIFVAPTNVGIVYTEVTYGSIFSKISGLLSSGISAISTFIAEVQNPNLLVTQPQVTTQNATPTFLSFLTFTYASNQLVTLTTTPQQGSIFYSVHNNGNVPLGPGTSNNLIVNMSCGSTVSPGAAEFCKDMLEQFTNPTETSSSPPKISNGSLLSVLAPGETKENDTFFDLTCPTQKLTFPLTMSFLATFLIKNYTAAVLFPVEFMSDSFQSQLISSDQAFVPSQPSFNFYSSGPVQIEVYSDIRQPVITKIDSLPLQITIKNNGNYPYHINNISIYISKQFYPTNPSTSYWACVNAEPIVRQGFQFPGSGYWDCYIDEGSILSSGSSFYLGLNAVNSLDGMHFNTMTILGYVNYNYNESLNMPVVVSNQTCTS